MYGERDLRKFGAHTQQRGAPHPEHCARPADGDSARNARNVARAHRACQRCADGLERRHRTVRGILFAEHTPDGGFDRIREFADLQKARPHTEQQPHADDAHHRRYAPHKVVDRLIDACNCFKNHKIPYLLPFDFAAKKQKACNPGLPAGFTSLLSVHDKYDLYLCYCSIARYRVLCNPPGGVLAAQFILSVKLFCGILRIIDTFLHKTDASTAPGPCCRNSLGRRPNKICFV